MTEGYQGLHGKLVNRLGTTGSSQEERVPVIPR
jgi:hypothetical protein